MTDPVRFGIIGIAGRGTSHARIIRNIENARLVAGADVVAEHVTAFEAETDGTGYTDHREMLAEEDLDAISVCTPSGLHPEHAIDAMTHGVNVLCEKPLGVHIEPVDEMIETADEHGVQLAGIFQRRFDPARWTARQWVEEDRFGDVIFGDAAVKWHRPQSYYEDGWHGTRDMDGGVLMQQAVHFVDLIQWLMGGVESVYAKSDTLVHEMECEDTIVVSFEFENGAYGSIQATTGVLGGQDHVEINGTDGSFNSGTFVLDGEQVEPDLVEPPFGTGMEGQIRDFTDAVRNGREPMVTGREARKAIEVVLAAYASANLGQEIRVEDVRDVAEST